MARLPPRRLSPAGASGQAQLKGGYVTLYKRHAKLLVPAQAWPLQSTSPISPHYPFLIFLPHFAQPQYSKTFFFNVLASYVSFLCMLVSRLPSRGLASKCHHAALPTRCRSTRSQPDQLVIANLPYRTRSKLNWTLQCQHAEYLKAMQHGAIV